MLTIQLKRLGKKKVKKIEYKIDIQPKTLKELISQCVISEVKTYNEKRENLQLISFLSAKEIQTQSEAGKVGIGDIENQTLAISEDALSKAYQSFLDGLFVVFINEDEITNIDQAINILKDTEISFIRMTFLTGTYW